MKKKKVGEVQGEGGMVAEFYLTDVTLVYPNKEPRVINYMDIHFLQDMIMEEKKKFVIGMYVRNPSTPKAPSLTFGDFTQSKEFLEAFYSVKNCIPNFEHELTGFEGNLMAGRQTKRCELGLDHKHLLIRSVEDEQDHFFRIEVNSCKVEAPTVYIKITLDQSQLEIINFLSKDDVFTFKNLMYQAIAESKKEHAVIYEDIEDIDKFKIFVLESSPYLKTLHEKLVVSGTMSESEFWESRSEFHEYKKYFIENRQKLVKSTGLLIKDKITSEAEKQKILNQFPEVSAAYFNEVMDGDTFNYEKDRKFWEEFMKLQKKKDTEIVGGKNTVAIPNFQQTPYQYGDGSKKIELAEIPLGEVDLSRNLDVKTNVAEKLMNDTLKEHYGNYESLRKDVETTIKKFQVHGLNVLGGIKPTSNIQGFTAQELINEFKDLVPEHFEIPEDMQIKTVKTSHFDSHDSHKESSGEKMLVEMMSSQITSQSLDGKSSKANSDAVASKLHKLLENKNELRDRRKNAFNKPEMLHVFRELVHASNVKSEALEYSQFREIYESYHEQANDLLRLFYSIGFSDEAAAEAKRRTLKNLINELIGKINIHLNELDKSLRRPTTGQNPDDKMKEATKLTKAIETIVEKLKFAANAKE